MRLMRSQTGGIIKRVSFLLLLCDLSLIGQANADLYYDCRNSQGEVYFTNVAPPSGYRCVILGGSRATQGYSLAPGLFEEIILSASERYGVDADLVRAVIKVESDFNPQARSHKGARGLMQLMPETARQRNVTNIYSPGENVDGGVRHLRFLLDLYRGDLRLTLAAYNAGIQAVERHRGIPPFPETRDYVRRVLDYHQRYRGNGAVSVR